MILIVSFVFFSQSVYQKTAFADLFEVMMKQALNQAINENVSFRKGLPVDIWHHFGQTYAKYNHNGRRQQIKNHIKTLFQKIEQYLDADDGVDKMAMKFQHDALPPVTKKIRTFSNFFFENRFCNENLLIYRYYAQLKRNIRLQERYQVLLKMV